MMSASDQAASYRVKQWHACVSMCAGINLLHHSCCSTDYIYMSVYCDTLSGHMVGNLLT
jgi:hypothetical protein